MKPKTSCREVVRAGQALFKSLDLGKVADDSGAYTQARQRLPKERLEQALAATAATADQRVRGQGRLNGRPIKVVDCSTTQLPDPAPNQAKFPQPSSQRPGCGFPRMQFLVLFSLGSGAISKIITDHWKSHDLRLCKRAWEFLQKGDILLGDRTYGDYVSVARLPLQGVDVLARLSAARKVDFRRAVKSLGRKDA